MKTSNLGSVLGQLLGLVLSARQRKRGRFGRISTRDRLIDKALDTAQRRLRRSRPVQRRS